MAGDLPNALPDKFILPRLPPKISIAAVFPGCSPLKPQPLTLFYPLISKLVDNNKRLQPLISIDMFRTIPLSLALINLGGLLTLVGFFAYAIADPTFNLIGFFYGIPLLLGGLALKSAELEPVPFTEVTSSSIIKLRDKQATPILNQIRKDVTRFRYGQEAHLDLALEKLGLAPSDDDRPILKGLHESEIDGAYALILEFYSPFMKIDIWHEKHQKITSFFGPGVKVQIEPDVEDAEINLTLIVEPNRDLATSPA